MCLFQASRIAWTVSGDSGRVRSTPLISAPQAGDNGVTWISSTSCMASPSPIRLAFSQSYPPAYEAQRPSAGANRARRTGAPLLVCLSFSRRRGGTYRMLNVGIIGLGGWGRRLVEAVQGKSDRLRFAAAVTGSPAKREAFAAQHGFKVSGDLKAM